jgi:putative transposase
VLICKAFRYRVYPTHEQIATAARWSDTLRFLWNLANEQRLIGLARERSERRYVTAFDQSKELTALRAALPWLAEVPRNVSAQLLHELDRAWQRSFKKLADVPRWKRKNIDVVNLCEPHSKRWRLNGAVLHFPKLGALRAVVHRSLEGAPKSCTLIRDGDQWFASIVCEIVIPEPIPRTDPVIAIDRGITNFVGTSNGELISGPQYLKASLKHLARAQRAVSRRKKGSKNREKAKRRVMRRYRKVRRQRHHFLHEQSARITKSHGVVVLENLNVAGMMRGRSARGIADAGWALFERMIRYKQDWSGGSVKLVPAPYSSQECDQCRYIDVASRRGEVFCCTKCGHRDHADINAAKVLLHRANRSVLPVEGELPESALRSRKAKVRLRGPRRHRPLQCHSL